MEDFDRPSGVVLPLILRRKIQSEYQQHKQSNEEIPNQLEEQYQKCEEWEDMIRQRTKTSNQKVETYYPYIKDSGLGPGSIYIYEELLDKFYQTNALVSEIQRHLHRGEEAYFDCTNAHGNVFKGWDTFIDSKLTTINNGGSMNNGMNQGCDNGGGGSGLLTKSDMQMMGMGGGGNKHSGMGINSGGSYNTSTVKKKMPSDDRWFSGSCSAPRMKYPIHYRDDGTIGIPRRHKSVSAHSNKRNINLISRSSSMPILSIPDQTIVKKNTKITNTTTLPSDQTKHHSRKQPKIVSNISTNSTTSSSTKTPITSKAPTTTKTFSSNTNPKITNNIIHPSNNKSTINSSQLNSSKNNASSSTTSQSNKSSTKVSKTNDKK